MKAYLLIVISLAVMLLGDPLGDAIGALIERSYECNHMDDFNKNAGERL